jgi:hypothetical protein
MKNTDTDRARQLVTDSEAPQGTRVYASRKTKPLEDAAIAAAKREREKSEGRAYSSTVKARNTEREIGMQSRLRHEWHATGEICEVPLLRPDLRSWKPGWNAVAKPRKSRRKVKTVRESRICACGCGESFIPSRSDAVVCNDRCRQRLHRARNAETRR